MQSIRVRRGRGLRARHQRDDGPPAALGSVPPDGLRRRGAGGVLARSGRVRQQRNEPGCVEARCCRDVVAATTRARADDAVQSSRSWRFRDDHGSRGGRRDRGGPAPRVHERRRVHLSRAIPTDSGHSLTDIRCGRHRPRWRRALMVGLGCLASITITPLGATSPRSKARWTLRRPHLARRVARGWPRSGRVRRERDRARGHRTRTRGGADRRRR